MSLNIIGIDLAKTIFHVCVCDHRGNIVGRHRFSASKLQAFLKAQARSIVAMEACGGAHHWARTVREYGHEARLISPQFVKPYVKSNKNDHNDAEAICEAASRPTMRFVTVKTTEQQNIQALHRTRELLIKHRTGLCNHARGIIFEYGIIIPQGRTHIINALKELTSDDVNQLSPDLRALLQILNESLQAVHARIVALDEQLKAIAQSDERCQRLQTIPGIGPMIATALVASVGNAQQFPSGRQMSAWLGLVPRQFSTGGTPRLGKISKRGDGYLRKLFVHGARSSALRGKRPPVEQEDRVQRWQRCLLERLPTNKAVVARANKNARIAWAILAHGCVYNAAN